MQKSFDISLPPCYDTPPEKQKEREAMKQNYVPYEKLSKKKRREIDAMRRGSWGALNPVTRVPANPRAYNRKKAQRRMDDLRFEPFLFV